MEFSKLEIDPQLCQKEDESLLKDLKLMNNYILEQKFDGTRILVHIGAESIKLFTRNGKSEVSSKYPELINSLKSQNLPENTILDGELIFINSNGEIEFQSALITKETMHERKLTPAIVLFDIVRYNGENLKNKPLIIRKQLLSEYITESNNIKISKVHEDPANYFDLFEIEVNSGREGVVVKLKDSEYTEGARNKTWMKFKRHDTTDCVVLGITKGTGKYESTFGALILGSIINNKLRVVGYCSGMTDEERNMLYNKFMTEDSYTYDKKFSKPILKTVYPGTTVEVEYMEISEYGVMRHPRFVQIRNDKDLVIPSSELPRKSEKIVTLDYFFGN